MSTASHVFRAVVAGALLTAIAAAAGLATHADPNRNYILRERFWMPLQTDPATRGLFRMDANKADEAAFEEAIEDALAEPDEGPALASASSGNVKDVSLHQTNAKAAGGFKWVREGKVGGAIEFLDGKQPSLSTASYPQLTGHGWNGGADAWFRPSAELKRDAVVLALAMRSGRHVRLIRLADGRVELRRGDEALFTSDTPLMPAGEWRHAALVVYTSEKTFLNGGRDWRPRAAGLRLLVQGRVLAEFGGMATNWLWSDSVGIVWFGSQPGGADTFAGLIDEARVSDQERLYYPLDTDFVDPAATRPLPDDWPWMRSRDDVVIHDSFDSPAP